MADHTALGDRMKAYEHVTRYRLPRRTYTIVRVDGRAFHTLLRHAERPFDHGVMAAMDTVAEALCGQMAGAVLAYTQSDECSVLVTDFSAPGTQPWFDGVVQKIASVAASTAAVAFNRAFNPAQDGAFATFDARAFTIPDAAEVGNYFVWRQRDAVRNSISMAAQARFPHCQLQGLTTGQMQELLWSQAGVNWNDYPAGCRRGRTTVRRTGEREVAFTHRRTRERHSTIATRSWWETQPAPRFTTDLDGWLGQTIPQPPYLSAAEEGSGHGPG